MHIALASMPVLLSTEEQYDTSLNSTTRDCKEKHLHRYLAEFDFRYNSRSALGVEDIERPVKAVAGAKGKRLTYRQADRPAATEAKG